MKTSIDIRVINRLKKSERNKREYIGKMIGELAKRVMRESMPDKVTREYMKMMYRITERF